MDPSKWAAVLSLFLFVGLLICLEIGFRIGERNTNKHADLAHEGVGVIEAAVFALFGLLLGFSFAGGTSRLDDRRQQIVQEANAIGTAYLRLDLLPADAQPEMRRLFREYINARLQTYERLGDAEELTAAANHVSQLQNEIWKHAVAASSRDATQNAPKLLLPALNEMIDITTTRMIALKTHLPALIFALLTCVALLSGLLAGYAMAKRRSRSWLHMFLYAAVVAVTVYTVLDLDYPRSGLIRLDAADDSLRQLRDAIH